LIFPTTVLVERGTYLQFATNCNREQNDLISVQHVNGNHSGSFFGEADGVLTTELDALQDPGNPKEARAPKGRQAAPPPGQIVTAARLANETRNVKYGAQEEAPTAHHIAERGPPSNVIEFGFYPGAGSFRHRGKTRKHEPHTGDNLKDEPSAVSNDWLSQVQSHARR
jgi:hypothetical protein